MFLCPFEIILCVDIDGKILFIGGPYSRLRNLLILEKEYLANSVSNKLESFMVLSVSFHAKERLLILGDEFGNISIWNLTPLLLKLNAFVYDHKISKKNFHSYQELV